MTDTFGGWELDDARDAWVDAPDDDPTLQRLLTVAAVACYAFAPDRSLWSRMGDGYYESFRTAVLMQTRNVWNASEVDASNGQIGDDTFQARPFPLDWMVKQLLRPKRGKPWVG